MTREHFAHVQIGESVRTILLNIFRSAVVYIVTHPNCKQNENGRGRASGVFCSIPLLAQNTHKSRGRCWSPILGTTLLVCNHDQKLG